jgi:hypothetical protein
MIYFPPGTIAWDKGYVLEETKAKRIVNRRLRVGSYIGFAYYTDVYTLENTSNVMEGCLHFIVLPFFRIELGRLKIHYK